MKELRTIIVDDEPDSVELLKLYLSKNFPEVNVVATFTNSTEALEQIPGMQLIFSLLI